MTDQPIRLVILLGSLRAGSLHRIIANALIVMELPGVSIEMLGSVGDLPHYDGDLQETGIPHAVSSMAKDIAEADGVIILTPEYNYSVPGALKNAIDWLSRIQPQPFAGKPVAIQTGSPGNIGGARAQYHLRQSLVFLDAITLNKPEVMISQIHTKIDAAAGTISDAGTADFLRSQIEALVTLVSNTKHMG